MNTDSTFVIDAAHIDHQRQWSERTFGPGLCTKHVIDHIQKELIEIADDPIDLKEWVDVIILAFDGAWRTGASSQEILDAIAAKQAKNELRQWPDWRTSDPNKAIEHVRTIKEALTPVVSPLFVVDEACPCYYGCDSDFITPCSMCKGTARRIKYRFYSDNAGNIERQAMYPVGKLTWEGVML